MSTPKPSGAQPIPCPPEVLTLVEHFERNRDDYKSGQYNEAQLRQQFLNPLFEALGWDMANRAGYAEAYKEVIHAQQATTHSQDRPRKDRSLAPDRRHRPPDRSVGV